MCSLGANPSPRKGTALFLAVAAVVMIGMLIVTLFFGATQENRIAMAVALEARAFNAAEHGQAVAFQSLDPKALDSLAIGGMSPAIAFVTEGGGVATVRVTRLQQNLYFLLSEGGAGTPPSEFVRRTGLFLRLVPIVSDSDSIVVFVPERLRQRAWASLF